MSSWEGFTDRLRRQMTLCRDETTRGYLETAARRIEELEIKLHSAENEVASLKRIAYGKLAE